jgi:hypothetical protein
VRLSDGDRELLYEQLKAHATAGRLSVEELERRVEAVAAAEDQKEAAALMADLPPVAPPPPEADRPRRGRGHAEADKPSPDWQPTEERFRDPRTARIMRVWVDSGGGRHYVPEDG